MIAMSKHAANFARIGSTVALTLCFVANASAQGLLIERPTPTRHPKLQRSEPEPIPSVRMGPNELQSQLAGELPQIQTPPDKRLLQGAKLGVYSALNSGAGIASVQLSEADAPTVLVLSTRDPVRWEITNTQTNLRAVLVSSATGQSQVQSSFAVPVYSVKLPFATSETGPSFRRLVRATGQLIDFDYVTSYFVEKEVRGVRWGPRAPSPRLRRTDEPLASPPERGEFFLIGPGGHPVKWTLSGPVRPQDRNVQVDFKATASPDGQLLFALSDALTIRDLRAKVTTRVEFPEATRRHFTPDGMHSVGYDASRKLVLVTASPFLLVYDLQKQAWMPVFRLRGGAQSVAFDRQANVYVTTASPLTLAKTEVDYIFSYRPRDEPQELPASGTDMRPTHGGGLPDMFETFDPGTVDYWLPRVYSAGSTTAVIAFDDRRVRRIWSYDPRNDKALLTYDSER